jgi:hypothetical protein
MWFKLGLHDLLIIIPLALKTDRTLSPFSFLSLFLNKMLLISASQHDNQSKSFTNQWIVVIYSHCHETRRPRKGFMSNSVLNRLDQTHVKILSLLFRQNTTTKIISSNISGSPYTKTWRCKVVAS